MKPSATIGLALLLGGLCAPALAQSAPERGVFVTQIGDGSRANIAQQNSESLARVVQDGNDNQVDLVQNGAAPHRALIAQNGDNNVIDASQDGDGSAEMTLLQDGNANLAMVVQSETSASDRSVAAVFQRGNGNSAILSQSGSDNEATLEQLGNANIMSASQQGEGNRLQWSQSGDGLSDLGIVQTGGANMQITQSNTGTAQFAPPPGSGG